MDERSQPCTACWSHHLPPLGEGCWRRDADLKARLAKFKMATGSKWIRLTTAQHQTMLKRVANLERERDDFQMKLLIAQTTADELHNTKSQLRKAEEERDKAVLDMRHAYLLLQQRISDEAEAEKLAKQNRNKLDEFVSRGQSP